MAETLVPPPVLPDSVNRPGLAQQRMAERRAPIIALLGGTQQMRAEGRTYLPQEPREESDVYYRRLVRSFLYEGYKDGVEGIVSRPFSRAVTARGLPDALGYLMTNCDGQGTDISTFSGKLFRDAVNFGMSHGFVDAPVPERLPSSRGDEQSMGLRPYFCRLWPPDVIGQVHGQRVPGGLPVLKQLRVRECRTVYESFSEKKQNLVRVWDLDSSGRVTWTLYAERVESPGSWYRDSGPMTVAAPDGIPHSGMLIDPASQSEAYPPLEGLAWMNVRHWVTSSDQNNILRVARCPILFNKLLADGQDLTIAVTKSISGGHPDSDLRWVEVNGASIEHGFTDIRDIELKMRQLSNEPLVRQSGNITATENAVGEAQSQSSAQSWVRLCEAQVERLFRIASAWTGIELDADFRVDIFNDFGVQARGLQDSATIIALMDKKYIPVEVGLAELQHRALLSDSLDVEQLSAEMAAERAKNDLRNSGLESLFGGQGNPQPAMAGSAA